MDQAPALARIVAVLRSMPDVIAIAAYGSTAEQAWGPYSDIDLLAVLRVDPPVESLRFFVDGVPVDLNFRSADDGEHGIGGSDFVPESVAIWDPDGLLARARPTRRTHRPEATDIVRFQLSHDLLKARQIADESERRVTLGLLADRVLNAWFQCRVEPYPGVVGATATLTARDPETLRRMNEALLSTDVELMEEAAWRATEPAGGPYRPGDVLAASWKRPGCEPVPDVFAPLAAIADTRD